MKRAETHATAAGVVEIPARPLERASIPETPLYEVQDQRYSGAWRVVAQFADPRAAEQVAALLRSAGGNVRIELIPQPLIP